MSIFNYSLLIRAYIERDIRISLRGWNIHDWRYEQKVNELVDEAITVQKPNVWKN